MQRARRQWLAAVLLSRGGGAYPSWGPHRGGRLRTGAAQGAAVGGGGDAEHPSGGTAAVATAIDTVAATAAAAAAAIVSVSGDGVYVNVASLFAPATPPGPPHHSLDALTQACSTMASRLTARALMPRRAASTATAVAKAGITAELRPPTPFSCGGGGGGA